MATKTTLSNLLGSKRASDVAGAYGISHTYDNPTTRMYDPLGIASGGLTNAINYGADYVRNLPGNTIRSLTGVGKPTPGLMPISSTQAPRATTWAGGNAGNLTKSSPSGANPEGSSGGYSEASEGSSGGGFMKDSGLELARYLENTDVQLTPYERNILDLVNQLVTGEYGNYKQMLSGTPDWGQLEQGVINPARQQLMNQTLPQIKDIASQSPYGAGYNTGATKAAQAGALSDFSNMYGQVRYQASEQAKAQSLQAMGLLPTFENIQAVERLNEIANVERAIGVHYRNQGLSVEEFNADMQFTNSVIQDEQFGESMEFNRERLDLERERFAFDQEMFNMQMQMQKDQQKAQEKASMFGGLGSLLGAGAGYLLAPATGGMSIPMSMMLGSSLGGSAGLFAGGAPTAGYQTLQGGMGDYQNMMLLQSLMKSKTPVYSQTDPWY